MRSAIRHRTLAVAAVLLGACSGDAPRPAPNLVLVSIDTLRADMLGAYGYDRDTSPAIDALAARGTLFENVVSPAPWTLPAHASLLTGLYPSRHRLKTWTARLPDDVPVLAALLGAHGWHTAAIVNSELLTERNALHRGYAEFVYVEEQEERRRPSQVAQLARRWLDAGPPHPFHLFLHFYDVHSGYHSLPRYESMFVSAYTGPVDGSTAQLLALREGRGTLTPEDLRHLRDLYAAGIRQLDAGVERLLRELRRRDLIDHTIVVLTSDHGEEFLDHGGLLHGRTQHRELLRVPLILAGPGIPAGLRVREPVSLVDVMPTLLSLLGLPAPADLDGADLTPLLRGESPPPLRDRVLFGEADHNNRTPDSTRSARRGRFKLIYDRSTGESALFDLGQDPGERRDLSAARPDLAARLRGEIDAFLERERSSPDATPAPGLGDEERERLRSLGYL